MPHILIIDDDPITRFVLQKTLEEQGHHVTTAENGEMGIEAAIQIRPALIICDWIMPGMDGLDVCCSIRSQPELATTFFLLMTARGAVDDRIKGLDAGADDFLSKPLDLNELKARIRAGLRLYQLSQDLHLQKQVLETELSEAADYVQSLLPATLSGNISIESRFIPSSRLGGDCFDYFWLDPDYLVIYLLDVSGHGIGAALLSTAILNVLRSQSLPAVNFYQPHHVLKALNETFPMTHQNDKYFTIWYGVYNRAKRQLTYASAGHPPGVLVSTNEDGETTTRCLSTPCLPIGILGDAIFCSDRCSILPESVLYIFSDGIYENYQTIDSSWGLDGFIHLLSEQKKTSRLDDILDRVYALSFQAPFRDDLSFLKISFT